MSKVDGVPVHKSTFFQLWSILYTVFDCELLHFAISIFYGDSKSNLQYFLNTFITKLNIRYSVFVKCFICDTPACSYLKCRKGQTGHYGCERCVQKGTSINKRLTFPSHNSDIRTDDNFVSQKYKEYHILEQSPLIKINGMKMMTMYEYGNAGYPISNCKW